MPEVILKSFDTLMKLVFLKRANQRQSTEAQQNARTD